MTRRVRFSIGVGLLAVSTVVVLVGINLDLFLEAWHLRKLASTDEATLSAARRSLVGLRSARAVPVLLERASGHSGEGESADLECAREILVAIEPPGLARLVRFLEREDPPVFLWAILLHENAPAEAKVRAHLLGLALESRTEGIRRYAAEKLAQLGGDASGTLAGLRRARRDPSEGVRFWAGIALRNLGEIETEELFSAETE